MEENERLTPQKPRKVSWWKLGVVALLLFLGMKAMLFPDPNIPEALKTSNQTQQVGEYIAYCLFCLVGMVFLVAGIRSAWPKSSK